MLSSHLYFFDTIRIGKNRRIQSEIIAWRRMWKSQNFDHGAAASVSVTQAAYVAALSSIAICVVKRRIFYDEYYGKCTT